MKVRLIAVSSFLLFMLAIVSLPANAQGPEGIPPEDVIRAEPVHGITIGPGKKLWVFVFPEKGRKPPTKPICPDSCFDDEQNLFALLGFQMPAAPGLTFNINDGSIPIDQSAVSSAIKNSFDHWEFADPDKILNVNPTGGASEPAADGNNTVGWVSIVPRGTLAAAWIWTTVIDGVETVTDADIFFNLFHKWGILLFCNEQGVFDVENVGTHEVGHVVGLGHVKDECANATMFPSPSLQVMLKI
ncbi:MAG: hypothetical protein NUV74_16285 [Candidatus Brocadiaceae bacterium]|nr:hypothetical protein [Candidatus Brocadiaceae bacterium]